MAEKEKILSILKAYKDELNGILGRFEHSRNAINIDAKDDPRFRQLVIELRDFIDDNLGKNKYSLMIGNEFIEGTANFTGSPSYKSVENIIGIVSSVITRIERNPEVLDNRPSTAVIAPQVVNKDLDLPQKITLAWLVKHVPYTFWIALIGLLISAILLGINASRISIVKEIFHLDAQQKTVIPTAPK